MTTNTASNHHHMHNTPSIINRKVYTNLNDFHYKEMMSIVDKYLKANPSVFFSL